VNFYGVRFLEFAVSGADSCLVWFSCVVLCCGFSGVAYYFFLESKVV
jgi:hypothetical protein